MENKIYVYVTEINKGILIFDKCNIKTTAYIGKNGVTLDKKEGDKKTPLGEFNIGIVLGMNIKNEKKRGLNFLKITDNMYWIDDINSKYYNQLVDITKIKKDWNLSEHLIDYPIQYEYLIEIKTNPNNIPGNGSAIFLHCTKNMPTAGCIAIDRENIKKIIENIDKNTKIKIDVLNKNR